jgi:hypothetical protein
MNSNNEDKPSRNALGMIAKTTALLFAVVLAACGGGGDNGDAASTESANSGMFEVLERAEPAIVKESIPVLKPGVETLGDKETTTLSAKTKISEVAILSQEASGFTPGQIFIYKNIPYRLLDEAPAEDGGYVMSAERVGPLEAYSDYKFYTRFGGLKYNDNYEAILNNQVSASESAKKITRELAKAIGTPTDSEEDLLRPFRCIKIEQNIKFSGLDKKELSYQDLELQDAALEGFEISINCNVGELVKSDNNFFRAIRLKATQKIAIDQQITVDAARGNEYYATTYASSTENVSISVEPLDFKDTTEIGKYCELKGGSFECDLFFSVGPTSIIKNIGGLDIQIGLKISIKGDGSVSLIDTQPLVLRRIVGVKNGAAFDTGLIRIPTPPTTNPFDSIQTAANGNINAIGPVRVGLAIIDTKILTVSYISLTLPFYAELAGEFNTTGETCTSAEVGIRGESSLVFFKSKLWEGIEQVAASADYPLYKAELFGKCAEISRRVNIDYKIQGSDFYKYNSTQSSSDTDFYDAGFEWIARKDRSGTPKHITIDMSKTRFESRKVINIEAAILNGAAGSKIVSIQNLNKDDPNSGKIVIDLGTTGPGQEISFRLKAYDPSGPSREATLFYRDVRIKFEELVTLSATRSLEKKPLTTEIWNIVTSIQSGDSVIRQASVEYANGLLVDRTYSLKTGIYSLAGKTPSVNKPVALHIWTNAMNGDSSMVFPITDAPLGMSVDRITITPKQVKVGENLTLKVVGRSLPAGLQLLVAGCSGVFESDDITYIKDRQSTLYREFKCKASEEVSDATAIVVGSPVRSEVYNVSGCLSNLPEGFGCSESAQGMLYEDFRGAALKHTVWTSRGSDSCGQTQHVNGKATFFGGSSADTKDKKTFSGKKIVIEALMGGTQGNRDTHFELVDAATGQTIQVGDTNDNATVAAGLYLVTNPGSGRNDFDQRGIEATTAKIQAYRLTLQGHSATLERGDSFTGAMSTHTFTLPRSIAGKTFYLRVGTGAADCVYSPGTFDSIKVTTESVLTNALSDDFNGDALDLTKWSSAGYGYEVNANTSLAGSYTIGNGAIDLGYAGGVATFGKQHFKGHKIVVEARVARTGGGEFPIALVNTQDLKDRITISDTGYCSAGFLGGVAGRFQFSKMYPTCNGSSGYTFLLGKPAAVGEWMEYRLTVEGTKFTMERGTTLDNITQSATETMNLPIDPFEWFLYFRTGSAGGYYGAKFDWIRVNVTPSAP